MQTRDPSLDLDQIVVLTDDATILLPGGRARSTQIWSTQDTLQLQERNSANSSTLASFQSVQPTKPKKLAAPKKYFTCLLVALAATDSIEKRNHDTAFVFGP